MPGSGRRAASGRVLRVGMTAPGQLRPEQRAAPLANPRAPPPPEDEPRPDTCWDRRPPNTSRGPDPIPAPPRSRGDARPDRLGPPRPSYRADPASRAAQSPQPLGGPGRAARGRRRRAGGGGGGGRDRGGGGEREGRRTGGRPLSLFPRDREIGSRQPIKACCDGAGRGGRPEARNYSFRPCAGRSSRRPRSTGWRESQKASSSTGQDGRRGGVAAGELRAGNAAAGLSPRRRSQRPFCRLCEPGGHGWGRGTGAGAPRRPEPGFLLSGRTGLGGAAPARPAGAPRSVGGAARAPAVSASAHQLAPDESAPPGPGGRCGGAARTARTSGRTDSSAGVARRRASARGPGRPERGPVPRRRRGRWREPDAPRVRRQGLHGFVGLLQGELDARVVSDSSRKESPTQQMGSTMTTGPIG